MAQKRKIIPTGAPTISAAEAARRAQNKAIFTEAWRQAREAAAKFGGKASQYVSAGGLGTAAELLKDIAYQRQQEAAAAEAEKIRAETEAAVHQAELEKLAASIIVPRSYLPAISYSALKGRAHRLVAKAGSDKFWMLNKGGRAGWDGLDVAQYDTWTDGSDVSVEEALTQDLLPWIKSQWIYDSILGKIVYTKKIDQFLMEGGNYADIPED